MFHTPNLDDKFDELVQQFGGARHFAHRRHEDVTLRFMGVLGVSSATRKCIATSASARQSHWHMMGGRANCCDESRIPGKIRNLSTFPDLPRVHVEKQILILETKMECRTGMFAGRKGVWTVAERY